MTRQLEQVLISQLARAGVSEQALYANFARKGRGETFLQYLKRMKNRSGSNLGERVYLPSHMDNSQRSFGNKRKRRVSNFRPMGALMPADIGAPYADERSIALTPSPEWRSRAPEPEPAPEPAPEPDELGEKRAFDDDAPFRMNDSRGPAPKTQMLDMPDFNTSIRPRTVNRVRLPDYDIPGLDQFALDDVMTGIRDSHTSTIGQYDNELQESFGHLEEGDLETARDVYRDTQAKKEALELDTHAAQLQVEAEQNERQVALTQIAAENNVFKLEPEIAELGPGNQQVQANMERNLEYAGHNHPHTRVLMQSPSNALVANTPDNINAIFPSDPQPQHSQTQMNPTINVGVDNDHKIPPPQIAQPSPGWQSKNPIFHTPPSHNLAVPGLDAYNQPQQALAITDPTILARPNQFEQIKQEQSVIREQRREDRREEAIEEAKEDLGVVRPAEDVSDLAKVQELEGPADIPALEQPTGETRPAEDVEIRGDDDKPKIPALDPSLAGGSREDYADMLRIKQQTPRSYPQCNLQLDFVPDICDQQTPRSYQVEHHLGGGRDLHKPNGQFSIF